MSSVRIPFLAVCATLFIVTAVSENPALTLESPAGRTAFYRDETPSFAVTVENASDMTLPAGMVTLNAGGVLIVEAPVGELPPKTKTHTRFTVPLTKLEAGAYTFTARYTAGDTEVIAEALVATAQRPNPSRLMIWLWGGGGSQWYLDHGFTTLSGPGWSDDYTADNWLRTLDQGLLAGADMGMRPNGGLRDVDPTAIDDPDATNAAMEKHEKNPIGNPFHAEVARIQNESNRRLMELVQHFPQVKTAFFNTEIVDGLEMNRNEAGLRLMEETLGFTERPSGEPKWVAKGVIADDDPLYAWWKYKYQQGNGLPLANKRTADMIRRYRPDILSVNDPYREAGFLDMFPGIDVVSTWTYTNPDPKMMLYIETLRAACRGSGAFPMHTVTLLNYPGQLAPTEDWMLMGPARTTVTTWINLSRAPQILGYYYSSACNPQDGDSFNIPYATSETIRDLSEQVFKPYGPFFTNAEIAPRRIAVLSSMASGIHGTSPNLLGSYHNYQVYHFYTLLAMNHLNADVLLDETVERYGLEGYDVLVLPKCDVLTESAFNQVRAFQERGGLVIADQYLGPELPDVLRFDFDFTYRKKISANAIANNADFAEWNDQLQPDSAELQQVTGVTALDDQRIMEEYAARLKEGLAGKVQAAVTCDTPRVLTNMLEKDGAQYLVLINDNRTYGERAGEKYKAVLDKLLPVDTRVTLHEWPHDTLSAYDMLNKKPLIAERAGEGWRFPVSLDTRGGTVIALYPKALERVRIEAPPSFEPGIETALAFLIEDSEGIPASGLQPLRVDLVRADGSASAYSGYYCARNGVLHLPVTPGLNAPPGAWTIKVEELTAGLAAEARVEVANRN